MINEPNRFRSRKGRFLFVFFAPLLFLGLGAIVMGLWNAVLPQLLLIKRISYWQAVGLLLLCRILFGGFRFGGRNGSRFGGGEGGAPWRSKWHNMTDEEKSNFKNEWRKRCEERKKAN